MARQPETRFQVIRTALSFAGVFLVLQLAQRSDAFSELTRPLVTILLRSVGLPATQEENSLLIGQLGIPWSRDCAGLNVLGILWAMILWTNRSEPDLGRQLLRLLLAVPAAFAANLARILTLIAYRHWFFPSVESPQLHYFMGFLWLVPAVWFFCPRGERTMGRYATETLQFAAGLSLLAPLLSAPGGNLVAVCTLLLLANTRFEIHASPRAALALMAWLASALWIGASSMESLWLPWLMACPAFTSSRALFSLHGLPLLLGTIPLVAMHNSAQWIIPVAAGLQWWHGKKMAEPEPPQVDASSVSLHQGRMAWAVVVSAALLLPFVAAPLHGLVAQRNTPPVAAMPRDIASGAYQVRLLGQPPDLALVWYEPTGQGRHHNLDVCMRYRGMTLQPTAVADVQTDGQSWMREFFLLPDGLALRYGDYLRHTFLPFSPAGIHLIASSPTNAMSAESFAAISGQSARELHRIQMKVLPAGRRAGDPSVIITP